MLTSFGNFLANFWNLYIMTTSADVPHCLLDGERMISTSHMSGIDSNSCVEPCASSSWLGSTATGVETAFLAGAWALCTCIQGKCASTRYLHDAAVQRIVSELLRHGRSANVGRAANLSVFALSKAHALIPTYSSNTARQ